jgi:putative Mg2+ transporter-C (MgtC) family protein
MSIRSDPIRVVQAVVIGISFLGAGTIFRREKSDHVEGLTTAASLLFSGTLGISVALRQFVLAVGATAL